MKTGRTGLAVWTGDGTLRMYELTESGFAQTWADSVPHASGLVADGFYPYLGFVETDSDLALLTAHAESSNPIRWNSWLIVSGKLSGPYNRPTSSFAYRGYPLISHQLRYAMWPSVHTDASIQWDGQGSVGYLSFQMLAPLSSANPRMTLNLLSPNERVYVCTTTESPLPPYRTYVAFGNMDNQPSFPDFLNAHITLPVGEEFQAGTFSSDSSLFFGVNRDTGLVFVYSIDYNAQTFTKVWEFREDALGKAHDIALSPDRRHVAISYNDEDTYSTVIYRRFGMVFQRYQELGSGIGRLLDFSGDGRLLIDAGLRSAYSYENGQFSEEVGLLSNVVSSGVLVQAVSHHVDIITSTSWFYDDSLLGLLEDTVDKQNLKLVLLDENATFDRTDATLAEVTNNGAYEVHGNGWPEGGVGLTGVGLQQGTIDSVMLAAEDVEQVIFGGNLSFWRAVIVEDGVPIIYTDFNQEVAVENGEQLTFSFESGIVVFST